MSDKKPSKHLQKIRQSSMEELMQLLQEKHNLEQEIYFIKLYINHLDNTIEGKQNIK